MTKGERVKKLNSVTRRRNIKLILLTLTGIMACSLSLWAGPNGAVPYPEGYRNWAHVKSALVGPQSAAFQSFGGLHHIYANEKAMEGYRTGRFPDGSVLVVDLLEVQESAGVTAEGSRRRIDVMMKDSRVFAETGGWGFEQFKGDSQTERLVDTQKAKACFACHAQQKDHDAVFSRYRK